MRNLMLFAAMIGALLMNQPRAAFSAETEKSCTLQVEGMTCGSCVKHVQDALKKVDGVKSAKVDVKDKSATVVYVAEKTNPEALAKAVTEEGYEAKVR